LQIGKVQTAPEPKMESCGSEGNPPPCEQLRNYTWIVNFGNKISRALNVFVTKITTHRGAFRKVRIGKTPKKLASICCP
jgi:hypothetical protein